MRPHEPSSPPGWVYRLLLQQQEIARQQQEILKGNRIIMALVQIEQTDIDNLAASLNTAISAVASEIQSLEAQVAAGQPLPAGSLNGLNTALANLQALEVPAPATNGGGDTPAPSTDNGV